MTNAHLQKEEEMVMLIAIAVIACILLALKYIPIRSETLIEGVFQRQEQNWHCSDWIDRKTAYTAFIFDYACWRCFENNIVPHGLGLDGHGNLPDIFGHYVCREEVPEKTRRTGTFVPQKGDSAKITVKRNIFDGIVAYGIEQTNFAEEFSTKQNRKYQEEWDAHLEAWEGIQAEQHSMTLEQYRAAKREEDIQKATETLGVTPEEVIASSWDKLPGFMLAFEARARRMSKELGRTVTSFELQSDYARRLRESTWPGLDCLSPGEAREYVSGEFSDVLNMRIEDHLAGCDGCKTLVSSCQNARASLEVTPGAECFSKEELTAMRKTGILPKERRDHANKCLSCYLRFGHEREAHMASPPGSECLAQDDLHNIHAKGKIPEAFRTHIQNCERCRSSSADHLQRYVGQTAPLPQTRLPSLQGIKETV